MPGKSSGRRNASFSAEEVIDALYQGLLDRPAEPDGRDRHARRLRDGRPLAELVYDIGHSREYFENWLRGSDVPALMSEAYAPGRRRPGEAPIYFLHSMKTGGTSLVAGMTALAEGRFCLTQVFLDHLVAMPPLLLESAAFLAGHLGFEALDYLSSATVTATVVRDPVERVLSHYTHVRRDPALRGEGDDLTLEEFVHSPRWWTYAHDFQAHNLTQWIDLRSFWRHRRPDEALGAIPSSMRPAASPLPVQAVFEFSPRPYAGEELRRRALERLEAVEHVGVTDDLDGLFAELAHRWGVSEVPALPRANASEARLAADRVPVRLRQEIMEANAVDLALYEAARDRAAGATPRAAPATAGPAPEPTDDLVMEPVLTGATVGTAGRADGKVDGRRWTASMPTDALAAASVAVPMVVAGLDTVTVRGVGLMSVVGVGPCLAFFTRRWRVTAASGLLAIALAVYLGVPDGVWGTADQLTVVVVLALICLAVTIGVLAMDRSGAGSSAGPG